MNPMLKIATIGSLLVYASIQSCKSELGTSPPPTVARETPQVKPPEPPAYPAPPPLTGDPSRCVTRRFHAGKNAWDVEVYEYDARLRSIGGRMHFDAEGRITRWDMSDTFRTYTYDSHGNLHEEANWKNDKLAHAQRWNNRYEGDPPRIVAVDVNDYREPKQRGEISLRIRFKYEASGLLESVTRKWARGTELHEYTWQADRIVAVHSRLEPRLWNGKMPFDEGVTYELDEHRRLKTFTVDGELPHGEGPLADGKPDHIRSFHYDDAGRLERMESDGWGGDVGPEDPDGKPDEITLFTPPCDPLVKLAPRLFGFPELHLPRSIAPPLR